MNEPIASLVASVLNDEWNIHTDTANTLNLTHKDYALELLFTKFTISHFGDDRGRTVIRLCEAEWMTPAEKRYVEECLNDWWAIRSKALDDERRADVREKFMQLVKQ